MERLRDPDLQEEPRKGLPAESEIVALGRPDAKPSSDIPFDCFSFSLVAQMVKDAPAMGETTAAHQAPPSMGFSRQEYWSGVPLPTVFHTI